MKHSTKLRLAHAATKADSEQPDEVNDDAENAADESDDDHENLESKLNEPATDDADRYRDQGFTRPRVLILCPVRKSALTVGVAQNCIVRERDVTLLLF